MFLGCYVSVSIESYLTFFLFSYFSSLSVSLSGFAKKFENEKLQKCVRFRKLISEVVSLYVSQSHFRFSLLFNFFFLKSLKSASWPGVEEDAKKNNSECLSIFLLALFVLFSYSLFFFSVLQSVSESRSLLARQEAYVQKKQRVLAEMEAELNSRSQEGLTFHPLINKKSKRLRR